MSGATNQIGIMQGRLSPPRSGRIQSFPLGTWREEFVAAKDCGFELIDWIVEGDGFTDNPLMSDEGVREMTDLAEKTGVRIGAVCADYFMDYPLLRCGREEVNERVEVLLKIAGRMSRAGIPYMEVPFVDHSAIRTPTELEGLVEIFRGILDAIAGFDVTLAFETSLPPQPFADFLTALNHRAAKANYDMGNSASLGYNPREELNAYGRHIVTVHVKDRVLGGGTVPLGSGHTDFDACFSLFNELNYTGPFILQAARGEDEISWNKKNRAFVTHYLRRNSG